MNGLNFKQRFVCFQFLLPSSCKFNDALSNSCKHLQIFHQFASITLQTLISCKLLQLHNWPSVSNQSYTFTIVILISDLFIINRLQSVAVAYFSKKTYAIKVTNFRVYLVLKHIIFLKKALYGANMLALLVYTISNIKYSKFYIYFKVFLPGSSYKLLELKKFSFVCFCKPILKSHL